MCPEDKKWAIPLPKSNGEREDLCFVSFDDSVIGELSQGVSCGGPICENHQGLIMI